MRPDRRKSKKWKLRNSERKIVLLFGDLLAAGVAVYLAIRLWGQFDYLGPTQEFILSRAPWFLFLPFLWVAILLFNVYDNRRTLSIRDTAIGLLVSAAVGFIIYLVVYFQLDQGSLPRRGILYFLSFSILFTFIWRLVYIRIFSLPGFMRRVLIVGAGDSGRSMLDVINDIWPPPFYTVGFVDDDESKLGQQIEGNPVLGSSQQLSEITEEHNVSDVIVAILGPMKGKMFQAILDVQQTGVEVVRMPVAYEQLLGKVPIHHLESDWLLRSFVDEVSRSAFYGTIKRLIDLLVSAAGLFFFMFLFPVIAVAIRVESKGPILYRQIRLGLGGKPYTVVKFRSMRQDAEADGKAHWASADDPRTTRVGRFLRKTHLDEFPQFINVFMGDMSMVGPRPERPELVANLEENIPFYRARLLVKPGVTGWAQVRYDKGASLEGSDEKLEYDLYYIKHRSLWMDFSIIAQTFGAVLGMKGE